MKALKRETTIANRRPAALSPPSIAGIAGSEGCSIFIFSFVFLSVTRRLGGEFALLSLKLSRSLLQESRCPFRLILGSTANAKQSSLQKRPFGQSHLHPLINRLHSVLHRQRSVRDDLSRNRLLPRNQLRRRHHFIHQPNPMRFLRRDHLPGQHHLQRKPLTHQARQPLRPAISRNNSQLHLRLPQLRVVASEPHSASKSQFASAANRKSIN